MTRRRARHVAARADQSGFALIYLALTLTVLMAMAGFSLDVGNWYYVAQREQKSADAAALAGVVYLPQRVAPGSASYDMAKTIGADNGFSPGQVAVSGVNGNPTQLAVSVTETVNNPFAGVVGYHSQTLTRRAIAEYESPVAIGSPSSIFGTESTFGGPGDPSWNNQTFNPNLWANVMGPSTDKANGDSVQANVCGSGVQDECTPAGTQLDYNPDGYFYRVNVDAGQRPPGALLAVEVFDPATVQVGDHCADNVGLEYAAGKSSPGPASNPYTTTSGANDAATRYAWGDNSNSGDSRNGDPTGRYCTGDNPNGATPPSTTYVVRQDLNPFTPAANPVVTTDGCAGEQFGAWPESYSPVDPRNNKYGLYDHLNAASPGYDPDLAKVFRQWVPVCVFDPTTAPAKDYFLQIRTNVPSTNDQPGVMQKPAQTPYPNTGGSNRFAIRTGWVSPNGAGVQWSPFAPNLQPTHSPNDPYVGGYTVKDKPAFVSASGLSISGQTFMGLYANAASGVVPNFYMARILPGAQGQVLEVRLWDIGDCSPSPACHPTLTFNEPASFNGGAIPICTIKAHDGSPALGTGAPQVTVLNNRSCSYTVGSASEDPNGTWYTIDIAVPSGYSCNASQASDCWFTMKYQVNAGGALNDTTTWGARLLGNPVRLVK